MFNSKKDFDYIDRKGRTWTRFQVKGLDAMEKDLLRMAKEVSVGIGQEAGIKAMTPVQRRIERNIIGQGLVDTGSILASSRITHGRHRRGMRVDVRIGTDKRGVYKRGARKNKRKPAYSLQNEYGTKDSAFGPTKERPFMQPAFDGFERAIAKDYQQALRNTIFKWKQKLNLK